MMDYEQFHVKYELFDAIVCERTIKINNSKELFQR